MTHEEALKRAVVWLGIMIEEADVEADETTIRISANSGDGAKAVIDEINLGDDLRAFKALGADAALGAAMWEGQ